MLCVQRAFPTVLLVDRDLIVQNFYGCRQRFVSLFSIDSILLCYIDLIIPAGKLITACILTVATSSLDPLLFALKSCFIWGVKFLGGGLLIRIYVHMYICPRATKMCTCIHKMMAV